MQNGEILLEKKTKDFFFLQEYKQEMPIVRSKI